MYVPPLTSVVVNVTAVFIIGDACGGCDGLWLAQRLHSDIAYSSMDLGKACMDCIECTIQLMDYGLNYDLDERASPCVDTTFRV